MRRVLLTGATSFPGLALAGRLRSLGAEVHAVIRPATDTAALDQLGVLTHVDEGDMPAIIGAARPEVVFHLANLYLRDHGASDVARLIDTNVTFGARVLDAVAGSGAAFVNVGTFAQKWGEPPRPLNLYAAAKEAFETLLAHYRDLGLAATTLVLFDTYGPGDTRRKLVPTLLAALDGGPPLALPDEEMVMDLTYRDDVAEALLAAGRGILAEPDVWRGRRFAASGFRHTIDEVVAVFERQAGVELPKRRGGWAVPERSVRIPWAGERAPGWSAKVTLAEGLARTIGESRRAG
ncbi:NAD-dependent epimerase/dehydratase family protein [Paramagnetospirillum caucaseum]|uniref:NAD-dependent epimerase/dehydratase family protein n=1 Tax=Paramagnetospirillum caucaseum TaxID=1244869 RepID=UPI001376866D|nr:NAD(P)-dependent oxidoreductase [Paramagnetospirillum caucaseum]